jgi:hypothetical protein
LACLDGGKETPSDVFGSSATFAYRLDVVDAAIRPEDPYIQ